MDMAVEMLELQAQRVSRPGIAFAPTASGRAEFDASFRTRRRPINWPHWGHQDRYGAAAPHDACWCR